MEEPDKSKKAKKSGGTAGKTGYRGGPVAPELIRIAREQPEQWAIRTQVVLPQAKGAWPWRQLKDGAE